MTELVFTYDTIDKLNRIKERLSSGETGVMLVDEIERLICLMLVEGSRSKVERLPLASYEGIQPVGLHNYEMRLNDLYSAVKSDAGMDTRQILCKVIELLIARHKGVS